MAEESRYPSFPLHLRDEVADTLNRIQAMRKERGRCLF
jgi:hypothetical protein